MTHHFTYRPSAAINMCHNRVRGFGLVELMVSLVITSFLLLGLMTVLSNTQNTNTTQTYLASIYDKERFASAIFSNAIQNAGYFPVVNNAGVNPNPAFVYLLSPTNHLGESTAQTMVASQVVGGTTSTANPEVDTLTTRFHSLNTDNPQAYNCAGIVSQSAPSGNIYESQISIQPISAGVITAGGVPSLVCNYGTDSGPFSANPLTVLIDGVTSMTIKYGIDATLSGSVTTYPYQTAAQINALPTTPINYWQRVRAVQVTLTFAPAPSITPGTTIVPPPYTQIFPVMYQIKGTW